MSKTFFILGGSSGIGLELAQNLSDQGHKVYATYNNTPRSNSQIEYFPLNVHEDFKLDFLPDVIDGFVYCPGSINLKPFKRLKPEEIVEDIQLHIVGFTKALQQLLPKLANSSGASVVSFSSVATQTGFNFHAQVGISKGACLLYTSPSPRDA